MSQNKTRIQSVSVRERRPLAQVQNNSSNSSRSHRSVPPPVQEPTLPHEDATRSLGFGERMLRNTAIAVAMLLCVVAVQSVDAPGAKQAGNLLSEVVSMDINESLGSLRFVSNLVPDSVSVFWNLGGEKHAVPSSAQVLHVFNDQEPWVGYGAGDALASAAGEVMSVSRDAVGRASVRVRHASGMETIYGNLLQTAVQEGDWVETGAVIGAARQLTFELRGEGRAMDPTPYLK